MHKHITYNSVSSEGFEPQRFLIPCDVFFSLGESQPKPMRVTADFLSRNDRELTVRKGEMVEVSIKMNQQLFFCSLLRCLNQWPGFFVVSTRSCWTNQSSGGKWGTTEGRKASFPIMSWVLQMSSRSRWVTLTLRSTSTQCVNMIGTSTKSNF